MQCFLTPHILSFWVNLQCGFLLSAQAPPLAVQPATASWLSSPHLGLDSSEFCVPVGEIRNTLESDVSLRG
jgi:hypothetical protein